MQTVSYCREIQAYRMKQTQTKTYSFCRIVLLYNSLPESVCNGKLLPFKNISTIPKTDLYFQLVFYFKTHCNTEEGKTVKFIGYL